MVTWPRFSQLPPSPIHVHKAPASLEGNGRKGEVNCRVIFKFQLLYIHSWRAEPRCFVATTEAAEAPPTEKGVNQTGRVLV